MVVKQKFTPGNSLISENPNLNITSIFFSFCDSDLLSDTWSKYLYTKSSVLWFGFHSYWYMVHYLDLTNGNNFCSERLLRSMNMNNIINQKKKNGGDIPSELAIAGSWVCSWNTDYRSQ